MALTGGTASFGNKNAAKGKTVTLTGAGLSGDDAGNYTLASVATATADITPKALTGAFTANNKPYDGTRGRDGPGTALPGVVSGDAVTLVVTDPKFDGQGRGTNKDVTGQLSG